MRTSEPSQLFHLRGAGLAGLAAAALLTGGCGRQEQNGPAGQPGILCRPAGATAFEAVCTLQREAGADGVILTVHHPDGGFRRLLITKDGRGVVAADGVLAAKVAISGDNQIEVTIDGDAYRLPATLKGKAFSKP